MPLWLLAGIITGVAAVVVMACCAIASRRADDEALFKHLAGRHNVQFTAEQKRALRRIWRQVGGPLR